MAAVRRKSGSTSARRIAAAPGTEARFLPALEELLAANGQLSIGTIGPIAGAAVANDEHNMLAALVRRPGESLKQLLERLDLAVHQAMESDIFTDEINFPRKPVR